MPPATLPGSRAANDFHFSITGVRVCDFTRVGCISLQEWRLDLKLTGASNSGKMRG